MHPAAAAACRRMMKDSYNKIPTVMEHLEIVEKFQNEISRS